MTAWWDGFLWGAAPAGLAASIANDLSHRIYRKTIKLQDETLEMKNRQIDSLIEAADKLVRRLQEEMDYQ